MPTKDNDMIASLIDRTIEEIQLFDMSDQNDESIRKQAAMITKDYFPVGILELDAIRYLEHQVREGVICVISTAGDESGASGFLDGLVHCGLLPQDIANQILVSGTRIDWDKMQIDHMNVGPLKLHGLELTFQKSIEDIKKRTQAVFANDPDHNDRALLEGFSEHGFVKRTVKNEQCVLPVGGVFFSNWLEVYENRNNIFGLHDKLSCP